MEVSARRRPAPQDACGWRGAPCVRHRRALRPGVCFVTLHAIDKFGAVSTIGQTARIWGRRGSSISRRAGALSDRMPGHHEGEQECTSSLV